MKHLLVPTDFSQTADVALVFALNLAEILPAKVTLLHSFEIVENLYTDYLGMNREFNNFILHDAKERLEKIKEGALKDFKEVEIGIEVSKFSLSESIRTFSKENKVDMIIMGTLGNSGLREKLWGSHTSAVIGKTEIPVIAIPSNYQWKNPENILLASKNFEQDSKILDFLFELSYLLSCDVKTAYFSKVDEKAGEFEKYKEKIKEYGDFLKKEYREDTITTAHLLGENFEDTLQKYITDNHIDILTMITYQNGFWKSLFNPSMSKQMSFHTDIPLLVIPAKYGE